MANGKAYQDREEEGTGTDMHIFITGTIICMHVYIVFAFRLLKLTYCITLIFSTFNEVR